MFARWFASSFALCGESNQAKMLLDEIAQRFPADTLINELWLPVIQAAVELQRGNAAQAIDKLKSTSRYEEAAEFWPPYLRGQAYLKLKESVGATAEFQKILDHRGYAPFSPLYPLAQLGLARGTQRQKAYDDLLTLWKDADAELPLLLAARKEAKSK
jgi:predicted Zn-dependent protease